jgi:Protein of unknown function (DUF3987)
VERHAKHEGRAGVIEDVKDKAASAAREWLATTEPNLLTDYVNLWRETTDAPLVYQLAGGLATISTLLGRKVNMDYGSGPLYPNLWILTLGPSSLFRKTTCLTQARNTISAIDESAVFPDESTREKLISTLSERPDGIFTFSEFGNFLATAKRDYMAGMKELLADLYDCPDRYRRETSGLGMLEIWNPYLVVLATSQTGWFLEKINELDLRSGFLARFLYVPAYTKERHCPFPPPLDQRGFEALVGSLNAVSTLNGRLALDAEAMNRYVAWVEQHERDLAEDDADRLSAFWTRLSPIALKLAMILHAAGNRREQRTIDVATIESTLKLVEVFKLGLRQLFTKDLALTHEQRNREKVLRHITKQTEAGGISRRDLQRATSLTRAAVDEALETLLAEERIEQSFSSSKSGKQQAVLRVLPAG